MFRSIITDEKRATNPRRVFRSLLILMVISVILYVVILYIMLRTNIIDSAVSKSWTRPDGWIHLVTQLMFPVLLGVLVSFLERIAQICSKQAYHVSVKAMLLYLLANIAFFYQKAYRYYEIHGKEPPALRISSTDYPRIEEELGPEKPKFINFTPWYISTIVKAPVITVVILVLLTSIDFKFAGIEFDFSSLDAQVLLMIAFVLGFYSRVAREQLNVIVKAIFGRAYSRAEEVFHVRPREAEVLIGGNCDFCTSPSTEVTWVTSAGTIDNHGLFVAPAANERSAVSGGTVLITAVPTDPNIPRATAAVTLRSYIIIGPQAIGYNVPAAQPYKIDPTIPPGDVIWSIESPDYGASITDTGSLTGPDEVKAKAGKAEYITITATSKKDDTKYAELKVYLE